MTRPERNLYLTLAVVSAVLAFLAAYDTHRREQLCKTACSSQPTGSVCEECRAWLPWIPYELPMGDRLPGEP
jgi:hypothetical protein